MGQERKGCQPHVVTLACGSRELECACRSENKNGAVEQSLRACVSGKRRVVDNIEDGLYNDWQDHQYVISTRTEQNLRFRPFVPIKAGPVVGCLLLHSTERS